MRSSFFFTSAKMSVKPGSGFGDHSFSHEFARGAQREGIIRRDERARLDRGDPALRDADQMIRAVDRDQEGRGDVLPAADEVRVAVHARGELVEHGASLSGSYQRIDRDHAVGPHDQRIDLGLGDRRVILQRQPRQRHDCFGERVEIARRLAAEAFQGGEGFHLADHRVRGGQIDRREAQAAVAVDFGVDAAGRHHDQRAGLAIDAVADQRLADAGRSSARPARGPA